MHLYKKGFSGFYKPTLFSIVIDSNNIIDSENKIREEFHDVLFHEYVHYLQDILTTFGLRNITYLVQQYSIINNEIINSVGNTFKIPYASNDFTLKTNKALFNIYWGTDELSFEDEDFEVLKIERQENLQAAPINLVSFINVDIIYKDVGLTRDAFYLGAIHFMENMAALLEKSHFPVRLPLFPYKVVEKVLAQLFFDGDFKKSNLISFMEDALHTYYPAEYLMQFYEYCNEKNFNFSNKSIIEFRKDYRIGWGANKIPLYKFFFSNIAYTKEAFRLIFNHEHLGKLKEWSTILLSNVVKLKRSGFSFNSLLLTPDAPNPNKTLNNLMLRLGTPIISDRENNVFMIAPKPGLEESMIFLLGLEAVISVIEGDLICKCLGFCKKVPEGDITNHMCYETPWERTKIKPPCIFAQLWIMWGFVKKEVVLN